MSMVVKANSKLPAITAQNVGRELYHGRQDVIQIVGDKDTLENIAWIFQDAPDMFELQFQYSSLVVRCRAGVKETNADNASPTSGAMPIAH